MGYPVRFYRGLNVFMLSHAGFRIPLLVFAESRSTTWAGISCKGRESELGHTSSSLGFRRVIRPTNPLEVETDQVEISTPANARFLIMPGI